MIVLTKGQENVLPYGKYRPFGKRKTMAGFGSVSVTGRNCPAEGSWEAWCDCMYQMDEAMRTRCRAPMIGAPWTEVGGIMRGLPRQPGGLIADALATAFPGMAQPTISDPNEVQQDPEMTETTQDQGIFGLPTTVLYVGGGVLAVGLAALFLSKRRGSKKR